MMIIIGFVAIIVFLGGVTLLNAVGPWFAKQIDRMPGPGSLDPTAQRVLQRQLAEGRHDAAFGPGFGGLLKVEKFGGLLKVEEEHDALDRRDAVAAAGRNEQAR
jgi:hypothetical protein